MRDGWTRRAVLGAAGAAASVLSGCSVFDREDPAPPPPDPLEPLLASTRALRTRYEQVLAAHPELAPRLDPLHEAHLAHETALLEAIGRPELASPGPGAWVPPTTTAAPTPSPTDPEDAVAELRDAEAAGREETRLACLSAPADRAWLLASLTAALATHQEVLR